MFRIALIRGLASGGITATVALGKAASTPPSNGVNGDILGVAAISGLATVIVALIYVLGPALVKRLNRSSDNGGGGDAIDVLAGELARKERTITELRKKLRDRDE